MRNMTKELSVLSFAVLVSLSSLAWAADKAKPNIILLDIEMPGMDGLTVARKLGSSLTNSVIVFVTAYDQ